MSKYTLNNHIVTSHAEQTHVCQLCGKVYGLCELLKKHNRVKHDTTARADITITSDTASPRLGWKCNDCDKVFQHKRSLENHAYSHTNSSVECEFCQKKLRNPATLERHKIKFHNKCIELNCSHCDEKFTSRVKLKHHLAVHGFVCKTCSGVFNTEPLLEEHVKIHTKEFSCQFCPKKFSTSITADTHTAKIHCQDPEHPCDNCGDKFITAKDLTKHMNIAHNEVSKRTQVVCDNCGKSFTTTSSLKKHILYNHQNQEKPHECPVCNRRFMSKADQTRHMERHSTEPGHSCELCTKKFYTKNDMLRHRKVSFWRVADD